MRGGSKLLADYPAALLLKSRFLLAADKIAEAVAPAQRAAQINPLPEFQWALADTLRAAGRADEAAKVEATLSTPARRTIRERLRCSWPHAASKLNSRSNSAQRELQDRADIFTHDALAWALAAAGRHEEAWPHMEKALAEGTIDARLFTHAGVLAAKLGRTSRSRVVAHQSPRSPAHVAPLGTTATRRGARRSGDAA